MSKTHRNQITEDRKASRAVRARTQRIVPSTDVPALYSANDRAWAGFYAKQQLDREAAAFEAVA